MQERLSLLLKEKSLTAVRFAEIMGVQASSISHLLSGRNKPNFDFVVKLLERFPDIDPDWFILGEGDMLRSISSESAPHAKETEISPMNLFSSALPPDQSSAADTTKVNPKHIRQIIILHDDDTFTVYSNKE